MSARWLDPSILRLANAPRPPPPPLRRTLYVRDPWRDWEPGERVDMCRSRPDPFTGTVTVSTGHWAKVVSWDRETGELVVEPGGELSDQPAPQRRRAARPPARPG